MAGYAQDGGERRANRWRMAAWAIAASPMLANLVAMQVSDEVNWGAADFLFAGLLIALVGGTFELAVRKSGNPAYRAAVAMALAAAFILVWANAAVGPSAARMILQT